MGKIISMIGKIFINLSLLIVLTGNVIAGDTISEGSPYYKIVEGLLEAVPDLRIVEISKDQLGLYKVEIDGGNILYINEKGTDFIVGSHYKVYKNGVLSITDIDKNKKRIDKINDISSTLLVYPAENEKASITLFTDISCGYCRKFHTQIEELVQRGVTVKYAAYPRAGIGSGAYKSMRSVWCSNNRYEAMDNAMSQHEVEAKDCDLPLTEHYLLGMEFGVSGTPTMVTDKGKMLVGFRDVDKLVSELGIESD